MVDQHEYGLLKEAPEEISETPIITKVVTITKQGLELIDTKSDP